MTALLMLVSVSTLAVAFTTKYARWELATGTTAFDEPPMLVFPPYRAVVEEVLVSEGEYVSKGQEIVRIRAPYALTGEQDPVEVRRSALAGLANEAESNDVVAEREASFSASAAKARLQEIDAQRLAIKSQLALQGEQTVALAAFVDKIESPEYREILPKVQLMDYRSRLASSMASEASLRGQLSENSVQRSEAESSLRRIYVDRQRQALDNGIYLASVKEELSELSMSRRGSLYSATEGTVAAVIAANGSTLETTEPALSVVREGSSIVGVVAATGSQVSRLRAGDQLRVRVQGFNYMVRGEVRAKVLGISKAPVFFTNVQAVGMDAKPAQYKLTIELDADSFRSVTGLDQLKVGMPFDAVINTGSAALVDRVFNKKPSQEDIDVTHLSK